MDERRKLKKSTNLDDQYKLKNINDVLADKIGKKNFDIINKEMEEIE